MPTDQSYGLRDIGRDELLQLGARADGSARRESSTRRSRYISLPLAYAQLIMNVSNLSGFCTSVPKEAKWDIKKRARKSFPIFNLRPLSFRDFPYFWKDTLFNDFSLRVEGEETGKTLQFGNSDLVLVFSCFCNFLVSNWPFTVNAFRILQRSPHPILLSRSKHLTDLYSHLHGSPGRNDEIVREVFLSPFVLLWWPDWNRNRIRPSEKKRR